jgi:predicted GIY-YIG superfamily endonuclease
VRRSRSVLRSLPRQAIDRETQIKAYRRSKKIALIDALNPEWLNLAPAQIPRRLRGSE